MNNPGTIVMTGASSGFGRHAAQRLLDDDPQVHLIVLVRGGRSRAVAGSLSSESGHDRVTGLDCDLGSLGSVHGAARSITTLIREQQVPPLTAIVGNAGLTVSDRTRASSDGFELTFAVNVLAHVALINGLRELLAAPSRIVLTTSGSHWGDFTHNRLWSLAFPHWDTVTALAAPGQDVGDPSSAAAGGRAYSTSKLAVLFLVHELARQLPDTSVYAFNPDFVTGTGLIRDAGPVVRGGLQVIAPLLRATRVGISARRAGDLLAAVAAGPSPGPSGAYLLRNQITQSSPASYNEERERTLWAEATALTSQSPDGRGLR